MERSDKNKNKTILLGVESSGITCGAGISINNQLRDEKVVNGKNIHSEKLAIFVNTILENLNLPVENLSGIVISAGPGSFTGLRIGYSLAKGIAHQLNIPIIEVPTLDVWAYQTNEQQILIMPLIDAYREEVFYSIYKWEKSEFKRTADYSISKIDNLPQIVKQKILIVGYVPEKIKSEVEKALSNYAVFPNKNNSMLSIAALLDLGYQKFKEKEFSDLNSCEPFYMRKFKGVS
jgi:tRNA threonylcarbamoyladenosine biosynthesis protein TsaB